MTERLDFTYNPEADAAYFDTAPDVADGDSVRQQVIDIKGEGQLILDWDKDGRLLGVEVLGASSVLRGSSLEIARRL